MVYEPLPDKKPLPEMPFVIENGEIASSELPRPLKIPQRVT